MTTEAEAARLRAEVRYWRDRAINLSLWTKWRNMWHYSTMVLLVLLVGWLAGRVLGLADGIGWMEAFGIGG